VLSVLPHLNFDRSFLVFDRPSRIEFGRVLGSASKGTLGNTASFRPQVNRRFRPRPFWTDPHYPFWL